MPESSPAPSRLREGRITRPYTGVDFVPHAVTCGADAILVKPVAPVRLVRRIAALTPFCLTVQAAPIEQGTDRRHYYWVCFGCLRVSPRRRSGGRRRQDVKSAMEASEQVAARRRMGTAEAPINK